MLIGMTKISMVNYVMRYQKKPVFSHAIKSGDEKSQNYNPEILSPSGNYTTLLQSTRT